MKHLEPRPYAVPETAARRLMEIAKGGEAINGRIHIEEINAPMLREGASGAEYWAGLQHAISKGWMEYHESGTFVTLTRAGADLFA